MGGKGSVLLKAVILSCLFIVFAYPAKTFASPGVGIDTGKINLTEPVQPGTSVSLQSVMVYNTGDSSGEFEMEVTYNEHQEQLKPDDKWIEFSPKRFTLEPNTAQQVSVTLQLPAGVSPAEYHAYLEAHLLSNEDGITHIATAAATKLFFTTAYVPHIIVAVPQSESVKVRDEHQNQLPPTDALITFGVHKIIADQEWRQKLF
jgi:hypothetical protein